MQGKGTLSRRSKKQASDRKLAIGIRESIPFAHQMVGGETEFDLASMTLPDDPGQLTNPSPELVRSIGAQNIRAGLRLYNGSGKRVPATEYTVIGTKISFTNITAGADEIFFGELRDVPVTSQAFMSGRKHSITGFLLPGETQFNLGFNVRLSDIDTATDRNGPIRVERQRVPQYLNTEFETPVTTEDGDYSLVRAGNTEFATVIEFNDPGSVLPGGLPEFISVETRQIQIDKETDSLRSEVEVLSGGLYRLADLFSQAQGVTVAEILQFSPSLIQLKQFGDLVFSMLDISIMTTYKKFAAHRTSNQLVAQNSDVAVLFDSVTKNDFSYNSGTGELTVDVSGFLTIHGAIDYTPNASGFRDVGIFKNGSAVKRSRFGSVGGGENTTAVIYDEIPCSPGDVFTIRARQNSGGNLNVGVSVEGLFTGTKFVAEFKETKTIKQILGLN